MSDNQQDIETVETSCKYCLNCGSELKGDYCHTCGQQAASANPTIKSVIWEYCYNAFLWDPKFFRTLWLLVSKPGILTKEFLSGRIVSQVHPLKLNMFMLFVFVTLFVLFSGEEKMNTSISSITNDERVFSAVQMEFLISDLEYAESVKASPRDTVLLSAPLLLSEKYPDIITNIKTIENTNGESLDKWIAVISRKLIEDDVFILGDNGYYSFNSKVKTKNQELEMFNAMGLRMVEISTRYFPIIVLLTAPFLSFSLRLVQRKQKQSRINRFIFSLHYTAFLELLIIFIYLLYLVVAPPMALLQWVLIIASWIYLTLAFRRVYGTVTWGKAISKALYASVVYLFIIVSVFICISFVAIVYAATQF